MKQDTSLGFAVWIKAWITTKLTTIILVLAAGACALCLGACSSSGAPASGAGESTDGSAVVSGSSDGETAGESADGEEAASEEDYSDRMPFKGMSEKYIGSTWMGEPDEVSEPSESGQYKGAVTYRWCAPNGDVIYSATVFEGKVKGTSKIKNHTDYWMDPGSYFAGSREFPNLEGTGEYIETSDGSIAREDPEDYSTPEEYADNAEDWFAQNSYDDPWDAAFEYWEENAL